MTRVGLLIAACLLALATSAAADVEDALARALAADDPQPVTRALLERPATIAELAQALPRALERGTSPEAIDALVRRALATAVAEAPDCRPLVAFATERDPAPAFGLGVIDGLAARLPQGREAPQDQGQAAEPDVAAALAALADRADEPALQRAAIEARGQLGQPLDWAWARRLVVALEQPGLGEVAQQALVRRTGQRHVGAPAWRAWTLRTLTPVPDLDVAGLRRLVSTERRERVEQRGRVVGRLAAEPHEALPHLQRVLAGLTPAELFASLGVLTEEGLARQQAELEQELVECVAQAFAETGDTEGFVDQIDAANTDASVAGGLARGLGRRARRAPAGSPLGLRRVTPLGLLDRLQERPERWIVVEVYGALPAALPALAEPWTSLLLEDLDGADDGVSRAAWEALRRITGWELPQSGAVWRRWLDDLAAEAGEEEDPEARSTRRRREAGAGSLGAISRGWGGDGFQVTSSQRQTQAPRVTPPGAAAGSGPDAGGGSGVWALALILLGLGGGLVAWLRTSMGSPAPSQAPPSELEQLVAALEPAPVRQVDEDTERYRRADRRLEAQAQALDEVGIFSWSRSNWKHGVARLEELLELVEADPEGFAPDELRAFRPDDACLRLLVERLHAIADAAQAAARACVLERGGPAGGDPVLERACDAWLTGAAFAGAEQAALDGALRRLEQRAWAGASFGPSAWQLLGDDVADALGVGTLTVAWACAEALGELRCRDAGVVGALGRLLWLEFDQRRALTLGYALCAIGGPAARDALLRALARWDREAYLALGLEEPLTTLEAPPPAVRDGDADDFRRLGLWRWLRGEPALALDAYREAILADPDDGRAWAECGWIQLESGQAEEGWVSFEWACQQADTGEAYLGRAQARRMLGKPNVEADLARGLAGDAPPPRGWCLRGELRLATDPQAALADFMSAVAADRYCVRGWVGRSRACAALQDSAGADAARARALELDPEAFARFPVEPAARYEAELEVADEAPDWQVAAAQLWETALSGAGVPAPELPALPAADDATLPALPGADDATLPAPGAEHDELPALPGGGPDGV